MSFCFGDPSGIRTPDPLLKRQTKFIAESLFSAKYPLQVPPNLALAYHLALGFLFT